VSAESGSNVVYIYEPNAGLADDEGIGRRWNNPVRNIWLEVNDTGVSEIEIVSPPSYNRIRSNPLMPSLLKEGEKGLTHVLKTVTLVGRWVVNES